MRKLKFKLDRRALEIIYFTFIRPILEYACVIFDNCTQYELNDIEKVQLEAARIVSGTTKLVSLALLYEELGWEQLSSRRRKYKLVLFYKMQNGLCRAYLTQLVPDQVGQASSYNLRNARKTDRRYMRQPNYTTILQLISPLRNKRLEHSTFKYSNLTHC